MPSHEHFGEAKLARPLAPRKVVELAWQLLEEGFDVHGASLKQKQKRGQTPLVSNTGGVGAHRVDKGAKPLPRNGQAVLDARRPRGRDDGAFEDAGRLEFGEPSRERSRRDALERLLELVEPYGAFVRRGPEDREHPAAPEEVRRTGDLLGERLAGSTPHGVAASPWARVRGRAPRRGS